MKYRLWSGRNRYGVKLDGFNSGKIYDNVFGVERIPNYVPYVGVGSNADGDPAWRGGSCKAFAPKIPWGYYHRPDVMQRLGIQKELGDK